MNFLQQLFQGGHQGGSPERRRGGGDILLPHQPDWSHPQEFHDPIVRPEDMLGLLEQAPVLEFTSQRYGFPIQWTPDPGFGITTEGEVKTPGLIHIEHLPNIAPYLFEDDPNDSLEHTLQRLAGRSANDCTMLRGWPITFGRLAHMLMFEAQFGIQNDPAYFMVYLSKEPFGANLENLSNLGFIDFQHLSRISAIYDQILTEEARERFHMVRPFYGGTAKYHGEGFGSAPFFFYTAPFVPYGEINLDAIRLTQGNDITGLVPHLTYAVQFNRHMNETIHRESTMAYTLAEYLVRPKESRPQSMMPQFESRFPRQRHELLVSTLVLLLASGGQLPSSHLINAGDMMGSIDERGNVHHCTWITLRGGPRALPDIQDGIAYLREHEEILPPYAEGLHYHPYGEVTEAEFQQAFKEAVGCFDRNALNRLRR